MSSELERRVTLAATVLISFWWGLAVAGVIWWLS